MSSDNNNTGRENKVLELYNQGKTTREIAKEQRLSLRDIGFILKKHGLSHGIAIVDEDKKSSNEKATHAYKLFSEGKKPVQVAIELGLREGQVNKFFREYWKLKRMDKLYQLYPEIEHCLPSFLKSYKVLKRKGLTVDNVEWFANAIETSVIKLPELQSQYQSLQNKVWGVQRRKQELERDCQAIQRQTIELTDTENTLQQNFDSLTEKVDDLYNEKSRLEQYVFRFKNGNRKYLEIRGIAEEIVNRLLAERGPLLTSVIIAVIQALRVNPDKYAIIFGNTKDDKNNEYLEALREVASSFLKALLNQMVDKTMVAAAVEGE